MTQAERLVQIVRCVDVLYECVKCRLDNNPKHPDPYGATLGECDWQSELHYWIWDAPKELQDA